MFESEKSSAGTESESKTDAEKNQKADEKNDDAKLGEAGLAALQKEREAREAADKEVKRLKKIVDDAETAARTREADEAKAKGDFEALAKTAQEERDALKADLAERDKRDLRTRVAAAAKLPPEFADRLIGDDEKALTEDAKTMAKHLKPPTAAETEAGAGQRSSGNGAAAPPKPGENAELAKAGYAFMPAGGVPIPDGM